MLAHGTEFLRARAAGMVDDDHITGKIGEILSGVTEGRQSVGEGTVYKFLGHNVQDPAAAVALWRDAAEEEVGPGALPPGSKETVPDDRSCKPEAAAWAPMPVKSRDVPTASLVMH